jgi:hypothetical protein
MAIKKNLQQQSSKASLRNKERTDGYCLVRKPHQHIRA